MDTVIQSVIVPTPERREGAVLIDDLASQRVERFLSTGLRKDEEALGHRLYAVIF